jgi:thiol:disulfide interchange protein DsbA
MTVLIRSAMAVLLFLQITGSQADTSRFVTGIEYQEIIPAQQTRAPQGKIEVVELFWYGCPHCYRLEPDLQKWLKNKPDNIYFYKMPAQYNKHWEIHAAAYYTAESLGLLDKMHMAIFKEIHDKGNKLANADQLAALFLRYGVTRDKFMKVFNSFAVRSRQAHAKGMAQRYGAHSVPTFIINGKYRTNETSAGSRKDMFAVIEELVASEAKAQKNNQVGDKKQ